MEIFQTFGVNIYLLAAEIVNFLIVLYILKRFLYNPLFVMLKKRENTIQEGLKKAEEGRTFLEKAKKEEAKILKDAHTKANAILNDARNERFAIIQDAEDKAKKQADLRMKEAKEQIIRDQKEIESHVVSKMSKIMVEFMERSTDDLFGKKEQQEVITRAMKKFNAEIK